MILYVDYEHPSTYSEDFANPLMAARARITYRLQDLTGQPCLLLRYRDVTPDVVARYGIGAVFISGNGAETDAYDPTELDGLRAVVASTTVPVFGFCGGMQFIGQVFGSELRRMGRTGDDRSPWVTERGYHPVQLIDPHPLTATLGDAPTFRHFHAWELSQVPDGFVCLAQTEQCRIQLIAHRSAPIAGSQFHPEYWTDDAPEGRVLLENFCRWVGLAS